MVKSVTRSSTGPQQSCVACSADFVPWVMAQPELRTAWQRLPRVKLARGQTLLAAGAPAYALWFVEAGLLRSFVLDEAGRERNRAFHAEGGWAGAAPTPQAADSVHTVAAIEASRLVELPHTLLLRWQAQHVALQSVLFEGLAASLAMQAQREAHLLLGDAATRYQRFVAAEPALAQRLALHHVASYLGITNVALSRIRARLGWARPRTASA